MTDLPAPTIDAALEAIASAPLPPPTSSEAALEHRPADGTARLLAVGPQLLEFDDAFPPELRTDVANGFLFAQLAADRAAADPSGAHPPDRRLWSDVHTATLLNVGWFVRADEAVERTAATLSGSVHEEIVPILTAALGPAAPSALILQALDGLSEAEPDTPWLTLFDRASERASAAQFQMAYARPGETPLVLLSAFDVLADRTVTHALFFKFAGTTATLRHRNTQLTLNRALFEAVRAPLAARVAEHALSRISAVPL